MISPIHQATKRKNPKEKALSEEKIKNKRNSNSSVHTAPTSHRKPLTVSSTI